MLLYLSHNTNLCPNKPHNRAYTPKLYTVSTKYCTYQIQRHVDNCYLKAKFYISATTKDKFMSDSWRLTKCIDIRIQITFRKQQWEYQTIQTADSEHFQSEIKRFSFNMTKKYFQLLICCLMLKRKKTFLIFLAVALSIFLSERHYSGSKMHWIASKVYIVQDYEHVLFSCVLIMIVTDTNILWL